MRRDLVAKLFDGENGFIPAVAGNKKFGLQLGSAAGREVHAEMRQPLVPGAGDAQLFGAILRRMPGQRMKFPGSELRSKKFRREFERRSRARRGALSRPEWPGGFANR